PMSDNTMDYQGFLKDKFHGKGGYDETYSSAISKSQVCGTNAVMYDISGTVTNQFNYIQIIVVILLLIMLFLILGSYVTPIRAILCIILSVTWTLALTFLVFQEFLAIPVCWIVPIVLFVVLLGLGLDYEIFVTTRVRENRIRGMSNDDAIDAAITSASGTISLCALIMGGTFCTLLIGSSSMLQEFGFALGIGIFIDGLFMVTYVGPALMHLLGDWSWKGPAFLQRKHKEE
ncbi:MAG: MMPL family transporter, partial [Methanomethylophilus sp.]|nr:MMPL family transporter [Methanomethylophilus sp.]